MTVHKCCSIVSSWACIRKLLSMGIWNVCWVWLWSIVMKICVEGSLGFFHFFNPFYKTFCTESSFSIGLFHVYLVIVFRWTFLMIFFFLFSFGRNCEKVWLDRLWKPKEFAQSTMAVVRVWINTIKENPLWLTVEIMLALSGVSCDIYIFIVINSYRTNELIGLKLKMLTCFRVRNTKWQPIGW